MTPTSFKETNKVYGAGNNPNTDQLPVCIAKADYNQGVPTVISKWNLSDEEMDQINKTKSIYLYVMGLQLPPMFLSVGNPFTEYGYKPIEIEY